MSHSKLTRSRRRISKDSGLVVPNQIPVSGQLKVSEKKPLSRGIFFFATCHNGDFINHSDRNFFSKTPSLVAAYQEGKYLRTSRNQGEKISFDKRSWDFPLNECTYAVRARLIETNPDNANNYVFATDQVLIPNIAIGFTATDNSFVVFFSSVNSRINSAANQFTLNQFVDIASTSGLDGPEFIVADRKLLTGSAISSVTTTSGPPSSSLFVGDRDDNLRRFNGEVEYIVFWDRALSADECIEFQKRPYELLEPA